MSKLAHSNDDTMEQIELDRLLERPDMLWILKATVSRTDYLAMSRDEAKSFLSTGIYCVNKAESNCDRTVIQYKGAA